MQIYYFRFVLFKSVRGVQQSLGESWDVFDSGWVPDFRQPGSQLRRPTFDLMRLDSLRFMSSHPPLPITLHVNLINRRPSFPIRWPHNTTLTRMSHLSTLIVIHPSDAERPRVRSAFGMLFDQVEFRHVHGSEETEGEVEG